MKRFLLIIHTIVLFSCNQNNIEGVWRKDNVELVISDDKLFVTIENKFVDFFFYNYSSGDTIILKNKDNNCYFDSLKLIDNSTFFKNELYPVGNKQYWQQLGLNDLELSFNRVNNPVHKEFLYLPKYSSDISTFRGFWENSNTETEYYFFTDSDSLNYSILKYNGVKYKQRFCIFSDTIVFYKPCSYNYTVFTYKLMNDSLILMTNQVGREFYFDRIGRLDTAK